MLPKLAGTQNVGPAHTERLCELCSNLQVLVGQSTAVHGQLAAGKNSSPAEHVSEDDEGQLSLGTQKQHWLHCIRAELAVMDDCTAAVPLSAVTQSGLSSSASFSLLCR